MTADTRDTGRPTFSISTRGCEKTSVDSEGMAAVLEQAGYAPGGQ